MKPLKHWVKAKELNSQLTDKSRLSDKPPNRLEADYITAVRAFDNAVEKGKIHELSRMLTTNFGTN